MLCRSFYWTVYQVRSVRSVTGNDLQARAGQGVTGAPDRSCSLRPWLLPGALCPGRGRRRGPVTFFMCGFSLSFFLLSFFLFFLSFFPFLKSMYLLETLEQGARCGPQPQNPGKFPNRLRGAPGWLRPRASGAASPPCPHSPGHTPCTLSPCQINE